MKTWTKESLKEAWLEGLKTHEQTTGRLRYRNKFCALGVLCDVYDPSRWLKNRYKSNDELNNEYFISYNSDISPPEDICAVFGKGDDFLLTDNGSRDGYPIEIADANDSGLTFSQISDLIKHFV